MEESGGTLREGGARRSLRDFSHLFLSGAGEAAAPPPAPAAPAAAPEAAEPDRPLRLQPGPTAAFLDGGEGWLRTFLTAETALLLARGQERVLVAEEGILFPTVAGHLGRILPRPELGGRLRLRTGWPASGEPALGEFLLVELPAQLPAAARPWLTGAGMVVVAAGEGQMARVRAFHQVKRLCSLRTAGKIGLVAGERPGSGLGRAFFHKLLAALPAADGDRIRFLGALPLEPAVERIMLPERKPALFWFAGSLTAAALAGIGSALRRHLAPASEEVPG